MDRFSYLSKKTNKALKVFAEAKASLQQVITQFEAESKRCEAEITKKQTEIESERQALTFINVEVEKSKKTIAKIEDLLGA